MNIIKNYIKRLLSLKLILFVFLFHSCKADKNQTKTDIAEVADDNAIEIITENMEFQMPDTISSGWNTFIYKNLSPHTHFFLVDKYPEGKTSLDAEKFVAPVFDSAMKLIMDGKTEEGFAEFQNLPEWFSEVVFVGGSGLLSPNQVGKTTIFLNPGKYMIECYVKMSNGVFHTSMGMTKDLVVTEMDSGNKELTPDVKISISSTEGIVFNDTISSGEKIFSVTFIDQITHENFVGHDIHLAKLNADSNLKELEIWMNWADPKGLIEPAPKNITFIGGLNDLPKGNVGYFEVNLEPGNYALVAEVPNALSKNMLKTFIVTQ